MATCIFDVNSSSLSRFIIMIKFLKLNQGCLWSSLQRCELKINNE